MLSMVFTILSTFSLFMALDFILGPPSKQQACFQGRLLPQTAAAGLPMGSQLSFFHEHHLPPSVDNLHISIRLTSEELAKHGFRLLASLTLGTLLETFLTLAKQRAILC